MHRPTLTKSLTLAACTLSLLLGGCVSVSKQQAGTGAGALVGGLLGSQIGKGSGKTAATLVGVLAGGVAGNQIGKYLDDRDRQQAAAASQRAFDTGASQQWRNPSTGNSGTIQVVDQPVQVNTPAHTSGRVCRTTKQTVNLANGTSRDDEVTACKGPNGWEVI